ncbi:hypothetical protein K7X08_023207 [Anisodus acutangulus]|uniref:Alpha-(1,6)-fucosyltransferase n=1 Tax=Anisodus acutangulus TaxID=402998 RepID=A0A9Q1R2G2_9SOLA|nr:hypothetical protein K7X08_023207 [Anisodus acutangulus]
MEQQRSLERVVSQRALQMGSSFPCQICVVGFLSGVCLTSLFLASFGAFQFGALSLSAFSSGISTSNSSSISGDCNVKQKNSDRRFFAQEKFAVGVDERVSLLYSSWGNLVTQSANEGNHLGKSNLPKAPHLEDCKLSAETNKRLDTRVRNDSFPLWTIWKGQLDNLLWTAEDEELQYYRHQTVSKGAYPPWIKGSDEENYPLTRKVQRDIWLHQHPMKCSDGNVKFLIADWERIPGFGIGAQIAGMCGLLAIAINEKRVLVTSYYNRADHNGCKGSSRSSWSCYFFPETSPECRDRAFELMKQKEAWEKGIIKIKENYTSKEIWSGRTPRSWGKPWSYLQPTTDINGSLITYHRKMDRRWWRAQAVRYLMRFQTEYTCDLLNHARHAAFGWEAARMVLESQVSDFPEGGEKHDIENFVWSSHKPWTPRPMLSMHVRMGDKACEMKVVGFKEYMQLVERIRKHFPELKSIWLSTEMQEVVDQSRLYPHWKFYYTNVTRQMGNMTMATYEASLGRETSTNYPLVNFLLATEADFFIGALGSTWCFLIDGMRNTGGKVMSGYLSVNKDRFW